MELLQQREHRSVLFLEQTLRYPNLVVGRNADEDLVIGSMVNRAEAEPVRNERLAGLLEIADDVRGVEKSRLLEAADRAAGVVREQDLPAKTRLMYPDAYLADSVSPLTLILEKHGLSLVELDLPSDQA